MTQDPFKEEYHLRKKLDDYHVDVPDFPMKPKRWERFIHVLASPAKNPLEQLISTTNRLMMLKIVPLVGTIALALVQFLLFLD